MHAIIYFPCDSPFIDIYGSYSKFFNSTARYQIAYYTTNNISEPFEVVIIVFDTLGVHFWILLWCVCVCIITETQIYAYRCVYYINYYEMRDRSLN